MRYTMLLWPHANARYQDQTLKLAEAELRLTLDRFAPNGRIAANDALGLPALDVEFDAPPAQDVIDAVRRHSLLYGLFEVREGLLAPVAGRWPARLGADLPAILKYKGKTNEMFLQLLVNAALYAGEFWKDDGARLRMLDPMCGRATSLFVAANRGWDAVGADVDRADLKEAERYFKRYLEYHRVKHGLSRSSRTLRQGGSAQECRFEYAPEGAPSGSLSLLALDACRVEEALGRNKFHLIACDLPYGVRHDAQLARGERPRGNWLEALLVRALPAWREALKGGGAVALSFNAQTFKLERLRALMEDAGFRVLRGGPWDGFEHWVEQAITRDVAVCVKPL